MWLSSSSVGRKFIMAITGACLVLFVTFHCLMNTVAICWPTAYNSICEFLGANWYALLASAGLAVLIIVHIIYAVMLTVQNRKARGSARYSISKRPKTVEWSSQNMLVLGIVILAFLVVHLIQFWAKMQLVEITGQETVIPAVAGTLFLQEAFQLPWTAIVYIIGFIALWFHFNHGFWSMFQSVGWDNTVWICRLKKIACWWASIVVLLFVAQAAVFTYNAKNGFYKTNPELRAQYQAMLAEETEKILGAEGSQIAMTVANTPWDQLSQMFAMSYQNIDAMKAQVESTSDPRMKADMQKQVELIEKGYNFFKYIEGENIMAQPIPGMGQPQQQQMTPEEQAAMEEAIRQQAAAQQGGEADAQAPDEQPAADTQDSNSNK